jgi:hypothetical protein
VRFEWYPLRCVAVDIGVDRWIVVEVTKKRKNIFLFYGMMRSMERCVATSGCGCVAVVSLDRGNQCGSNGTSYMVWLCVLACICG